MHVRFSANAEADIRDIIGFLEPRNVRACERIVTAIMTSSYQLGRFPLLGRLGRVEDTRELSVPHTPYIIVYTLPDAFHVDIENILHDRRQWPPVGDQTG